MTTTDLWKLGGLAFVLVDHYGLFFDEEQDWWRVFGRVAAPIFFFLIGFARARTVPWTWLALGLLLTVTDVATADGDFDDVSLNILLNFALIRWSLAAVEGAVLPSLGRTALLVAVLIALVPFAGRVLEYGTEGWLWALFGLTQRVVLDRGEARAALTRTGIALAAGLAYIVKEVADYEFTGPHVAVLALLVGGLVLLLTRFRRAELPWAPPGPIAVLLRVCGRYSLEIYALSLFVMQVLDYGLESDGDDAAES